MPPIPNQLGMAQRAFVSRSDNKTLPFMGAKKKLENRNQSPCLFVSVSRGIFSVECKSNGSV